MMQDGGGTYSCLYQSFTATPTPPLLRQLNLHICHPYTLIDSVNSESSCHCRTPPYHIHYNTITTTLIIYCSLNRHISHSPLFSPSTNHMTTTATHRPYLFFISSFGILVAYFLCYTCRESWLKNLEQKVRNRRKLCFILRYEHMM